MARRPARFHTPPRFHPHPHRRRLPRFGGCLGLLALLAGCAGPTDVAEQFHDALASEDGARAFGLLSKRSQEELGRIAKAAHDASGGTVPDDPRQMIVRGDRSIYPRPTAAHPHVARASLVSRKDGRAKVTVRIGEATHEMDLVQEQGRWKVDLPLKSP